MVIVNMPSSIEVPKPWRKRKLVTPEFISESSTKNMFSIVYEKYLEIGELPGAVRARVAKDNDSLVAFPRKARWITDSEDENKVIPVEKDGGWKTQEAEGEIQRGNKILTKAEMEESLWDDSIAPVWGPRGEVPQEAASAALMQDPMSETPRWCRNSGVKCPRSQPAPCRCRNPGRVPQESAYSEIGVTLVILLIRVSGRRGKIWPLDAKRARTACTLR